MRIFLALLFLTAISHSSFSQKNEILFRIKEKDLIPEGIAYDAPSKTFFVGSIAKKKIVKIDANKVVSDFVPTDLDGLGEVLGMKVFNGSLWACNNLDSAEVKKSMVHQFNINTGKLIRKWTLHAPGEPHLFNDIMVLNETTAIITDSNGGSLYRIDNQSTSPSLFVKDSQLRFINGVVLTPDGKELIVNGLRGFLRINLASKSITPIPFQGYYSFGIDGLYWYDNSLIGLQNVVYPASVSRYFLDSEFKQIKTARVLTFDNPDWNIPTTGVVVGDWLYYIANSQLFNYEKGVIKDPGLLKEVLIMRVSLK
jgi:hypothetical protein